MRHEVAGFLDIEGIGTGIVPGDLLPAVVDGGGVPAFELKQVAVREVARFGRHGTETGC